MVFINKKPKIFLFAKNKDFFAILANKLIDNII